MSGIINFIKNLVGGIFDFLGGLFSKKPALEGGTNQSGKKGNSGYFLEFADSQSANPAAANPSAAISSGNGAAPTEPKKSTRKEQLAAAKAASNSNSATTTTATKAPAKPKSVPVEAVVTVPSEVGFASKYPIQISGGRRRPGANMNSYLDMARQMK
ncbi:hypothetical protein AB3R30_01765 [Leptolyngbyaceae cyanobacterium UHCC 1019]